MLSKATILAQTSAVLGMQATSLVSASIIHQETGLGELFLLLPISSQATTCSVYLFQVPLQQKTSSRVTTSAQMEVE